MRRFSPLAMALASVSLVLLPALAHADVPPPPGQKAVPYSFAVTGLGAAPEQVLFAFPCGTSEGAPVAEHRKIEEGKSISVGRRGGECTTYTISKAKYEAFAASYKPSNTPTDPVLDALAKDSVKCDGGPSPKFELPTSDPRSAIADTYAVKTLSATACALTTTTPAPPTPTAPTPSVTPSATPSVTPSASPTTPGRTTTAPSGGGGCSAAPGTGPRGLLLFGAGLALALGAAGRRRSRR